jgi:hypothetical protein
MRQEDAQTDWDAFVKSVTWFARGREQSANLVPLPTRGLATEAAELFPNLDLLLRSASVTEVSVETGRRRTRSRSRYELHGWARSDGKRFGWLCMPRSEVLSAPLYEDHRTLLRSFGGIVERFNQPDDTWLLNLNDALTERAAASVDPDAYAAVFDGPLPIDVEPYYPIAIEANGNTTLCHRESGEILLFAPDHSCDHITVLSGCPDYTFYTVDGARVFREWVETIAQQWLRHLVRVPE